MNLTDLMTLIRVELSDTTEFFSDEEISRAVEKSISLLSRHIPKKAIIETVIIKRIDNETLTVRDNKGILNKKPIKVESEVIPGKTRNVDYKINYLTGVITGLPDENYTISYELDDYILDLSPFLSNFIRIERVEYPVKTSPASYTSFELIGDFIALRELSLSENEHLRIIYLSRWQSPSSSESGDYPNHLNDAIIIGSAGQCLIYKAEKYVQEVIEILKTAKVSAMDSSTSLTKASEALELARSQFSAANASVGGMTASLDSASSKLGAVDTDLTSARTYLTTGDDFINAVTAGEDVARTYAQYAESHIRIAATLVNQGSQYIALAGGRSEKAMRETIIANGYINEAIQYLTSAARYFEKSSREESIANQLLNTAGRFLASGQAKINEFLTMLGVKPELQPVTIMGKQPRY